MAKVRDVQEKRPPIVWSKKKRMTVTAILVLLGIYAIWFSYHASYLGFISQWIIAIMSMVIVGSLIKDANSLNGGYGLYLLSTTRGIEFIDRLSKKNNDFWNAMSIWGLVLGFGFLAHPFLKGKISKRLMAFGIVCIVFVLLFVYPFFLDGFQFIQISQLQSALQGASSVAQPTAVPWTTYLFYAVAIVFGLVGFIFVALFLNAAETVIKILTFAQTVAAGAPQASTLSGIIPGVAPLIPGVTIPLLAGICALAILLVPHELSHGVLSRMAKVKIKSVGLVFIGIIPMGAFVEPDEKQVVKLDAVRQTRLLAAGTSANFVMMFLFFVLLYVTVTFVMPMFYVNKVIIQGVVTNDPAYGYLQPGMQILQWNGVPVTNITTAEQGAAMDKPGGLVNIVTSNGTYTLTAITDPSNSTRGLIGIEIEQAYLPANSGILVTVLAFFYSLFALSLLLNFSLAVMNLLPLPFFDGWRLFKVNVKNNNITKGIAWVVVILIFLNLIAWVFIPFLG